MIKKRLDKLANELSKSELKIGVWLCPQEAPPMFDEYEPLVVVISPDDILSTKEIRLKKKYLKEHDDYKRSLE